MKNCIVFIVFGLLIPCLALAQPNYTSTNKGAIKNYETATGFYDNYQNEKAKNELEKAINKDPRFIEAYILLANIFVDMRDYEGAVEQYKIAIGINPNFFPITITPWLLLS
ncbi:MAG: hypothetical protein IPP71_14935 [Bacteroidetes bacterium]|nr:hypothetical protein [Bacteroidota bacterium]